MGQRPEVGPFPESPGLSGTGQESSDLCSLPVTRLPPHLSLRPSEPTRFGHGWISGVLAVLFGVLGFGAVLCLTFPHWLAFDDLRARYPLRLVRGVVQVVLALAFVFGVLSVWLRRNKALGLTGLALTLVALLLGGAEARARTAADSPFGVGLDWFLLNLLGYSLVFVPLERLFALRAGQPIFRAEWRTDLVYFMVSALFVQATTFVTLTPATIAAAPLRSATLTATVANLPLLVQVVAILVLVDFVQYWVHRAFHRVPWLWRFHAVHHSATTMDWLAGSRLHLVDVIVTRSATYVPIYLLGFSLPAFAVYLGLVVVQATFIHANVRWELPWLGRFVVTPRFHHWHHSDAPDAIDKNFAVHTPLWDWLFGTHYLPATFPSGYGLAPGVRVPGGWWRQFWYGFGAKA